MSDCAEKDKESMECSNCKAVANGKQKGHGAADRCCPIFLNCVDRMNKTRKENMYKYFCTANPVTWETSLENYEGDQNMPDTQGYVSNPQWQEGARGRLGRGNGGEGGGGGQKGIDRGWGGVNADTRAGGNKGYDSSQTEATNHGSGNSMASGSKGKEANRNYRKETQVGQGIGLSQTTLKELWKGGATT